MVVREPKKVEKKKETKEEILISVDIKGEVIAPGMYSVKENMRVLDVINQAGGLTENADTTVINLSKKVQDEMVIIIYSKEQVKNFEETKKLEEMVQEKCKNPDDNSITNDACITSETITTTDITLNSKLVSTYRELIKSDAVIKEVTTYSGTALVTTGDVVKKGDLLVVNAYPDSVVVTGEVAFVNGEEISRLVIWII